MGREGTGREDRRARGRRPALGAGLALVALLAGGLGARTAIPLGGHRADASSAAASQREHLLNDAASSLRAARNAANAGDVLGARALLAEVAARHSVVADYAELLHVRLLVEQGETEEAAVRVEKALAQYGESILASDFYELQGEIRLALHDEAGARAAWLEAIATSRSRDRRPPLLLAIAQSFERTGEPAAAAERYLAIWTSMPLVDEALEAEARLSELDPTAALRTGGEWRRRADQIFRKRRNELALAAYRKALELGLSDPDSRRARRQIAQLLFRMRDYPRAVKEFAALPQEDDVPIWHARSLARAGRVREAVAEFKTFSSEVGGDLRTRSTYLAALLLEDLDGGQEESRSLFLEVAKTGRNPGLGGAAVWRLGWSSYRERRWADAIALWDTVIDAGDEPLAELRARYWRARAREHDGDVTAGEEFLRIALEYPLSYYGWRARARVDAPAASSKALVPPVKRGRNRLTSADLARPRILLEAGLLEAASMELQRVSGRARSLQDRLQVAELFRAAGLYHDAQRLVVDAYSELLARAPIPSMEDLWWHAWPYAYSELVGDATAGEGSVAPELVYSIMREESGYRADAISPVGARGLLQIMEETGQRLAARAGRDPISADDLLEPETNIDLGTQYLGELARRFGGRLAPAIASYNAGPSAVARWIDETPRDEDEWVEEIPYEQTRRYVKRVLRSVYAYGVLY